MAVWATLFVAVCCVLAVTRGQDVRAPPKITTPSTIDTKYINDQERVEVQCSATGTPKPTYEWWYEGELLSSSAVPSFDPMTGLLTIDKFTRDLEGEYTCKAKNVFTNPTGSSEAADLSPPLTLIERRLGTFFPRPPKNKAVSEYSYVKFECDNQKESFPKHVTYGWYESESDQIKTDETDGRYYIDDTGTLHIIYTLETDTRTNTKFYKCSMTAVDAQTINLGMTYTLEVSPVTNPQGIPPTLEYKTPTEPFLIYSTAKLECVFSGYDPATESHLPIIKWYNDNNEEIKTSGRYKLFDNNQRLEISDITEMDEKTYYCEARLTNGPISGREDVLLDVTSPPIWIEQPHDETKPEHKEAKFVCNARSASTEKPPEVPVWRINGSPIRGKYSDTSKYHFSVDRKILTVKNLKKATDILCVQCSVKNHVGITIAGACLNVIKPTTVITHPPPKQEIVHGDVIQLTVTAETDPGVKQLIYEWHYKNETTPYSKPPPHVTAFDETRVAYMNTSELTKEEYENVGGVYEIILRHPDETVVVSTEVILKDEPIAAAVASSGIDMWIIGLIIGILFLIIVIIIIIFVICRKKLEGDYNVDRKETGAGLDPEKELKEKGFSDLSRPDYDDYDYPDKKPRGDMEYDDVPIGGDDESLGEYGEENEGRFNEDGSFIGVYQKRDTQNRDLQATESTI